MIKKFKDGLVFGAGFAISFITIWYTAAYILNPLITAAQLEQLKDEYPVVTAPIINHAETHEKLIEHGSQMPFHELEIDEQIKQSSVIAIAKYEAAPDGQMKAIIQEFIKKDPKITIYYNVGDEYPSSSYYPKDNTSHGDGLVMFFTGSPAKMRMSLTYSGNRIRGLGDLPLKLFREKCKTNNA